VTVLDRVFGPPGTGKTTWLSRQCWNATGRYGADRVVVASLTRAAAHEVAGRDTGLPRDAVGTLHAHAFRALDRPPLAETPEGLKEWNAAARAGDQLSGGAARDPEWAAPEDLAAGGQAGTEADRLLADCGVLRARMTPLERWPGGGEQGRLAAFHRRWCDWKRAAGRVDFADLIETCLRDRVGLPQEPDVIFLDEAQDMSALEMALALQWGADADRLVTVGDPLQNLYEWRGSDPSAFTDPPAATERTLSQSHRVPGAVRDYAVAWAAPIGGPSIAYEPTSEAGDVRELAAATYRDPRPLADALRRDAADGQSAMALASCAYMLAPLVSALRDAGTPFHNPYRPASGAWNPLAGMQRLAALLALDPDCWGADAHVWTWREVWRWAEPLKAQGVFTRGGKGGLEGLAKQRAQFDGSDLGDRQCDPAALRSYLDPGAALAIGQGDLAWYEAHLLESWRKRMEFPLRVARREGLEALRETPRVIVGTVHSVKGGEADSVYVMPDLSQAAYHGPPGQAAARGWASGGEARHPTVRQFYVAFTRARHRLTLCGAATGMEVSWPRP
jgi:DNA helicase-2/ATP-dependent DNA helicase PcrA